jgi:hypothetical protein
MRNERKTFFNKKKSLHNQIKLPLEDVEIYEFQGEVERKNSISPVYSTILHTVFMWPPTGYYSEEWMNKLQ